MRINSLKARLIGGEPCCGIWLSLPSPASARLLARLPCDWLLVDAEHSPMGIETMTQIVSTIVDARGPAPLVRVPEATVESIKRALDAGASGIVAPMINTRAEAQAVVAAAKFPPLGQRSFGSPWAGLAFDLTMPGYLRKANEQTLAIVQVESAAALERLGDIMGVPGLDGVFVGPVDLSISLGLDIESQPEHPLLEEAIAEVLDAARANGLPAGIYCSTPEVARRRIEQGFLLVNVASDVTALLRGVRADLEAMTGQ
jgi:2-keto-3-deoxy-L-rhamnonate aldolase RhmA